MQRRRLLGAVLVSTTGLLAGCTSGDDGDGDGEPGDRDGDGVPDAEDDYPDDDGRSEELDSHDQTETIHEDESVEYTIRVDEAATLDLDFSVRDGPNVDVVFMTREEYRRMDDDTAADVNEDVTVWDSDGASASTELDPEAYRLIVDNTNAGAAVPPANFEDDVAVVDVAFEVYR